MIERLILLRCISRMLLHPMRVFEAQLLARLSACQVGTSLTAIHVILQWVCYAHNAK